MMVIMVVTLDVHIFVRMSLFLTWNSIDIKMLSLFKFLKEKILKKNVNVRLRSLKIIIPSEVLNKLSIKYY